MTNQNIADLNALADHRERHGTYKGETTTPSGTAPTEPKGNSPIPCPTCHGTGWIETGIDSGAIGHGHACRQCVAGWIDVSVPYPAFCFHPEKCAGRSNCPREFCCAD